MNLSISRVDNVPAKFALYVVPASAFHPNVKTYMTDCIIKHIYVCITIVIYECVIAKFQNYIKAVISTK